MPVQLFAISLDLRPLASSSCKPSCANPHSCWPEGVLHYVYRHAVSSPELIYLSHFSILIRCAMSVTLVLVFNLHQCIHHRLLISLRWGKGLPYRLHIKSSGHNLPRGSSTDWWVLTTVNSAQTNGLTCLPKHGRARQIK
jgi:hypothetical protein